MHQSLDLAKKNLQRGKYRRALRGFQDLVEVEGVESQAYSGAARCYNALSQPDQAATAAIRALELDPLLVDPHVILASVHLQKHRYDECEREIQRISQLHPNSAYVDHMSGVLLDNKGQFPEAVEKMKKAIAEEPKQSTFRVSLAKLYQRMGDHNAAFREYRNALKYSRSFGAVADVILSFVSYYQRMVIVFLILPIIIPGIYSLPLMIASSGYMALLAWVFLNRGKYIWGIGIVAVSFFITSAYIFHLLYGI